MTVSTTTTSTTTAAQVPIPRGRKAPLPLIPTHIKRMRYLLVGTVFASAYSIFLSIKLTAKLSMLFAPTLVIAMWTLTFLFPLEMAHHEHRVGAVGVGAGSRAEEEEAKQEVVTTWVVDGSIIRRSYVTSLGWLVCASRSARSTVWAEQAGVGPEVVIVCVLELGVALALYRLSTQWTEAASATTDSVLAEKGVATKVGSNKVAGVPASST